jgi:hypothetical protein
MERLQDMDKGEVAVQTDLPAHSNVRKILDAIDYSLYIRVQGSHGSVQKREPVGPTAFNPKLTRCNCNDKFLRDLGTLSASFKLIAICVSALQLPSSWQAHTDRYRLTASALSKPQSSRYSSSLRTI